jgi:hypothetical protein
MALTVSAFPGKVVIGQGALRGNMAYFELSGEEGRKVANAMNEASAEAISMSLEVNKED